MTKISNYVRPGAAGVVFPATPGSTGGTLGSVTDGVSTVAPVLGVDFTAGATVTDLGGGVAGVAVSAMTNPMTTQDDLIVGGVPSAGVAPPGRLGKGSDGQVLTVDPVTHHLSWATPGTGLTNPMTTVGDLIVGGTVTGGVAAPTRLAASTSTYVLTANGAGVAPTWQAPPGGGSGALVLLEQHTASSSATLDFTTAISSTYDDYQIDFVGILPATNGDNIQMRMGTGGGPTWDAGANYGSGSQEWQIGGSADGGANSGQTAISLTRNGIANGASTYTLNGRLLLFSTSAGGRYTEANGMVSYQYSVSALRIVSDFFGTYLSTTAVTAVRFLMSSGNIASGTIRMYGVAK